MGVGLKNFIFAEIFVGSKRVVFSSVCYTERWLDYFHLCLYSPGQQLQIIKFLRTESGSTREKKPFKPASTIKHFKTFQILSIEHSNNSQWRRGRNSICKYQMRGLRAVFQILSQFTVWYPEISLVDPNSWDFPWLLIQTKSVSYTHLTLPTIHLV